MSRGLGAFDVVDAVVPDALALLVAIVTQLGDVWFVGVLLAALYWYTDGEIADPDDVVAAIGLVIGALALTYLLKYVFALPRPPSRLLLAEQVPPAVRPLYAATGTASGYGFPSGHAVASTTVYGLLAQRLSIRTRRWRYGVAAALVTVVCSARVVLGVHYVVDVVAGVAVGATYVALTWVALSRVEDAATVAFGVAAGLSALTVTVIGIGPESVALLGTSVVGLTWRAGLRRRDAASTSPTS